MKMLLLMTLVVRYFVIVVILFSCSKKNLVSHSIHGNTQGTFYSVKYFSDKKNIQKKDLDSLLSTLDMSLSSYINTSSISKINNNISNKLDQHLEKVIDRSLQICYESEGAFDITVAPIVNKYGFGPNKKNNYTVGSSFLFNNVGCDKILLQNGVIKKNKENIELDVNGIAQGYSVDVLGAFFKKKEINDFIINIGGEIYCSGTKIGNPWLVAIEKPISNIQKQKYIIRLSNQALATSGNYRKFYKIDDEIISHTINPKTLKPVTNDLISVSIMADNCMDADAYATACMSMGLKKAKLFVEKQKIEACFIYKKNNDTLTYMTDVLFDLVLPSSPDFSDLHLSSEFDPR